jgi:FixJ family two-component response regulator
VHERAPTVYVVDDDVSMRESLELLIRHAGWWPQVYASAREFLAHPRASEASCLLLDVTMPDLNGLALQEQIGDDHACMPIIFITGNWDIPTTVQAMKAGAFEFLTKPLAKNVLLNAIGGAIDRSRQALCEEAALASLRERYESLTVRERKVMELVVSGLLNKQVADELGISVITVKAHRGKTMRKMMAGSLADLIGMAAKLRLRRQTDSGLRDTKASVNTAGH